MRSTAEAMILMIRCLGSLTFCSKRLYQLGKRAKEQRPDGGSLNDYKNLFYFSAVFSPMSVINGWYRSSILLVNGPIERSIAPANPAV